MKEKKCKCLERWGVNSPNCTGIAQGVRSFSCAECRPIWRKEYRRNYDRGRIRGDRWGAFKSLRPKKTNKICQVCEKRRIPEDHRFMCRKCHENADHIKDEAGLVLNKEVRQKANIAFEAMDEIFLREQVQHFNMERDGLDKLAEMFPEYV